MTPKLAWLTVAFLGVVFLEAGVVPGRWDMVETLEAGTPIVIRLHSREVREGTFQSLDSDALVVLDPQARRLELPRAMIREVSTRGGHRQSRFWNAGRGALVGLALGAAIGLVGGDDGIFDDFSRGGAAIILGGVGAGGGALVGHVVKSSSEAPRLLYVARVSP